jgi:O-antigen/teichoic acid export membrane protein
MINRPVHRRIVTAALAGGLTRVLRFADQIILVPLLLAAWGTEQYGEWIALNAVAYFANIANLGLADAASSDIVLRHSSGDTHAARRAFSTFFVVLTLALSCGYLALVGVVQVVGLSKILSLQAISIHEAKFVVLAAGLSQLLYFYTIPLGGAIGAVLGAGRPALFFGIARAAELVGVAIALQFGATPLVVALVMLAAVILNIVMSVVAARSCAPWLSVKLSDFDTGTLRRTWTASLGFFGFFISSALIGVNVPRLLIFHFLGAAPLTTFMVLVTYTRAARMIALAVSQSTQIEIGRAFGNGRVDLAKRLIEGVIGVTTGLALVLLLAQLALASFIVPAWTRGHVSVAWGLLAILAVVAFVGTYFDTLTTTLAALNRIALAAAGYGLGLAIGLLVAVILLPSLGLPAMAIGLLCPELLGSLAAMRGLSAVIPNPLKLAVPRAFWPAGLLSGKMGEND